MKRSKKQESTVEEKSLNVDKFIGLNTFGPHADLREGELRNIVNQDIYTDYLKSRRGSSLFIEDVCPDFNVLQHVVFDAGDDEYVIIQQANGVNSEFRSIKLESGSLWTDVTFKTSGLPYTIASLEKADMFVSNGKIYVFQEAGNSILEFSAGTFKRRKMGLPAPQIESVTTGIGDLKGKRVYGVELVYKDTTVSPNVDLIVSGPNRSKTTVSPLFGEGSLAYTLEGPDLAFTVDVSPTCNDGTLLTDAINDNWTHIRLWRSEDVTTATNAPQENADESEITGRPDELYQVQEMDKASFLATLSGGFYHFALDNILDDDKPFPNTVVTQDRLELVPVPNASIGVFHKNRIWASGVLNVAGPTGDITVPNIESKIFYSPETDTKYSESMNVLNAIESDPGDGQKMKRLFSLREDLIGIKESKYGRVRNGDPDLNWTPEEDNIGIEDKEFAQYVPSVGICARVNDQKDFRILGFDLQWRNYLNGIDISRPIRDIIKNYTPEDVDFLYVNGKLMISDGKGNLLVLAVEQGAGWSQYSYPFNDKSEAVFTFAEGQRALVINGGQPVIEIEAEDSEFNYIDTDYNPITFENDPILVPLTTHKFQESNGRFLIEEKFISIVADASQTFVHQAYVNGKLWQIPFSSILDPTEYPDNSLKETEYQAYQEYRSVGNYIHYDIQTTAPCTIYSIQLQCQVQKGSIKPGFDPFGVLVDPIDRPSWSYFNLEEQTNDPVYFVDEQDLETFDIEEF